jgi:hypothetical protein
MQYRIPIVGGILLIMFCSQLIDCEIFDRFLPNIFIGIVVVSFI